MEPENEENAESTETFSETSTSAPTTSSPNNNNNLCVIEKQF